MNKLISIYKNKAVLLFLGILAHGTFLEASNVNYIVALENVTSYSQRTWGIHISEVNGQMLAQSPSLMIGASNQVTVVHPINGSFRKCQQNSMQNSSGITASSRKPVINPTQLLTGSSCFFYLCPVPNNIPYMDYIPNMTSILVNASVGNNATDVPLWYSVLDYCALFPPITVSILSAEAQTLFPNINYQSYYPEGYFNITLKLSVQADAVVNQPNSTYSSYLPNLL